MNVAVIGSPRRSWSMSAGPVHISGRAALNRNTLRPHPDSVKLLPLLLGAARGHLQGHIASHCRHMLGRCWRSSCGHPLQGAFSLRSRCDSKQAQAHTAASPGIIAKLHLDSQRMMHRCLSLSFTSPLHHPGLQRRMLLLLSLRHAMHTHVAHGSHGEYSAV